MQDETLAAPGWGVPVLGEDTAAPALGPDALLGCLVGSWIGSWETLKGPNSCTVSDTVPVRQG